MSKLMKTALVVAMVLSLAAPAYARSSHANEHGVSGHGNAAHAKPVFVSQPYVAKDKSTVATDFAVWGYVNPKVASTTPATLTIQAQSWAGHGSWVATSALDTTGTLSATGKFRNKTNYTAVMNIAATGRYRLHAKLVWTDAAGATRTKWSSWEYIQIVPVTYSVSHPYVARDRSRVATDFAVWGFVNPTMPSTTEATLTIKAQQWAGHGSWVATSGLDTTATLSATGKFRNKTNYTAVINIAATGRYRLHAKLTWIDAAGATHVKWSYWEYIRIVN